MVDSLVRINSHLSRREFLMLGISSVGGLVFFPPSIQPEQHQTQLGRIAATKCDLYDYPSLDGQIVKTYWKDMILQIDAVTVGDPEPPHNRIWYRIGNEGYAHSGVIQPVKTRLNNPKSELPAEGALVEVTVPYTDAHKGPGKNTPFAYRYYYETTYWATAVIQDGLGEFWYRIRDDKWKNSLFAQAQHLRLIPLDELAPISPEVPAGEKRLEVRLNDQMAIAFEKEQPVFATRIASGAIFSNGRHLTPLGRHKTFHKRPSRHMAAGDLASNGYDLPGVPWICYIDERGVALHGTYWHNDFGRPRSHGCINLSSSAAKWIYRWTNPVVPPDIQDVYENFGTRVDIVE